MSLSVFKGLPIPKGHAIRAQQRFKNELRKLNAPGNSNGLKNLSDCVIFSIDELSEFIEKAKEYLGTIEQDRDKWGVAIYNMVNGDEDILPERLKNKPSVMLVASIVDPIDGHRQVSRIENIVERGLAQLTEEEQLNPELIDDSFNNRIQISFDGDLLEVGQKYP
jgi:hypothetical protein